MIASCCVLPASAGNASNVPQYGQNGGYLAIGDSISRGCCADGYYKDQYGRRYLRNVDGSYSYLVAQAVGCNCPEDITDQSGTYWPLAYPGMTTAIAMDVLGFDDGFSDEKLNYAEYDDVLKYFGYEGSFEGVRGEKYVEGECGICGKINELVENAGLITVELGMCDVFYRSYHIISDGGMLADGLSFDLSNPQAILELLKGAVDLMTEGYNYWVEWYPVLIQNIQKMNPDATIVMIGSFNLVNQMPLNDDSAFPLGSIFSNITDQMNKKYEEWADEFGVLYANIENTETLATESDWSVLDDFLADDNSFIGSHPSQNGHDYIARQILDLLCEKEETTDIIIDLGRFTKVDYVMLNGCPILNYEVDGYKLIIPCNGKNASNVTIGIVNEDNTLSVQTYGLKYADGRYEAYRIIGTNDAEGLIRRIIESIKNLFNKLIVAFKGLFG